MLKEAEQWYKQYEIFMQEQEQPEQKQTVEFQGGTALKETEQ